MQTNYFLVFYMGNVQGGTSYGSVAIEVKSAFLNQVETVDFIKMHVGLKTCTITNIIRLTKEEFDVWNVQ